MKTELKDISPTRKQIDVEIDAAAVRTVYDRISDNYAKAASVPMMEQRDDEALRNLAGLRFHASHGLRDERWRAITGAATKARTVSIT